MGYLKRWADGQLQEGTGVISDAKDSDQQQASEADAGPEIVQVAAVGPWVCHALFSGCKDIAAMRGSHDSFHRQVSVEHTADVFLTDREKSTGQEDSAPVCYLVCEQASQEPEQEAAASIVESVLDDVQAAARAWSLREADLMRSNHAQQSHADHVAMLWICRSQCIESHFWKQKMNDIDGQTLRSRCWAQSEPALRTPVQMFRWNLNVVCKGEPSNSLKELVWSLQILSYVLGL